jgi:hypothetical protein
MAIRAGAIFEPSHNSIYGREAQRDCRQDGMAYKIS